MIQKGRGFGFVRRTLSGNDLFVHARELKGGGLRELEIGQQIQFRIRPTEKVNFLNYRKF